MSAEQVEMVQLRRDKRGSRWRTRSRAGLQPNGLRARSQKDVPAGP